MKHTIKKSKNFVEKSMVFVSGNFYLGDKIIDKEAVYRPEIALHQKSVNCDTIN